MFDQSSSVSKDILPSVFGAQFAPCGSMYVLCIAGAIPSSDILFAPYAQAVQHLTRHDFYISSPYLGELSDLANPLDPDEGGIDDAQLRICCIFDLETGNNDLAET